jgi:hypothetical protein
MTVEPISSGRELHSSEVFVHVAVVGSLLAVGESTDCSFVFCATDKHFFIFLSYQSVIRLKNLKNTDKKGNAKANLC